MVLGWCRQPAAGWSLLVVLYPTAALPSLRLALIMLAWQPLVLVIAATVAAVRCGWAGLRASRPDRQQRAIPTPGGSPPRSTRRSIRLWSGNRPQPQATFDRANATLMCTRVPM